MCSTDRDRDRERDRNENIIRIVFDDELCSSVRKTHRLFGLMNAKNSMEKEWIVRTSNAVF